MESDEFLGFFKSYCEQDLVEMKRIKAGIDNKSKTLPLTHRSLITSIEGHTLFSLFPDDIELHKQINKMVGSDKFENNTDFDDR